MQEIIIEKPFENNRDYLYYDKIFKKCGTVIPVITQAKLKVVGTPDTIKKIGVELKALKIEFVTKNN
jgi:hypothetical protein